MAASGNWRMNAVAHAGRFSARAGIVQIPHKNAAAQQIRHSWQTTPAANREDCEHIKRRSRL